MQAVQPQLHYRPRFSLGVGVNNGLTLPHAGGGNRHLGVRRGGGGGGGARVGGKGGGNGRVGQGLKSIIDFSDREGSFSILNLFQM